MKLVINQLYKRLYSKSGLLAVASGLLLLSIPFPDWRWLYFPTQTTKTLFLGWGVVVIIAGLSVITYPKIKKISLNLLDLFIGLLFIYCTIHLLWIRPVNPDKLFILQWILLGIMYIVFRIEDSRHIFILILFLMLAGIGQSIYGNMQLFGILHSNHNLFKLTGSFFNPGPYSGYLISIFPVALGFMLTSKMILANYVGEKLCVILKNISLVTIITILLILPAGGSRVAWLSLVISSLYFIIVTGKLNPVLQKVLNTSLKKWILNVIIIFAIITIITGLYLLKKNSADGRLLIWKITANAIKDQPLWGHGLDKFKSFYMDYQAQYFESNPGTKESMVASDVIYPFNEPLRIASETGLIGLIVILALFTSAFKNNNIEKKDVEFHLIPFARAGLISILVFSFFSYPMEILPIMVNVVLYLAIIAKFKEPSFQISMKLNNLSKLTISGVLILFLFLGVNLLYRLNKSYSSWNYAVQTYNMGDFDSAAKEYEKIKPELKYNGNFLIYYGKALSMAGRNAEAINVLENAKNYLNNSILYTTLGDCYKETGQTSKAEVSYVHASHMVPSRFYPQYLLAKLYEESSQHDKAVEIAQKLLHKEIKVDSKAIDEIKEEMEKIVRLKN